MDIRRMLYSVVRKWWLIVLLAVLGGGIGYLNDNITKPIYRADTKLFIMNLDRVSSDGQPLKSSDIELSDLLVRQYNEIVYSRSVASAVSQEVREYHLSENAILSMVKIVMKEDSNIFTISATGSDPAVAAAVANAAGRVFSTKIREISKSNSVGILDEAIVPKYPLNYTGGRNILLGVLAGIIIAFSVIYIIDYFDTTVRSVEDIEKGLKVNVIGIIPEYDIR